MSKRRSVLTAGFGLLAIALPVALTLSTTLAWAQEASAETPTEMSAIEPVTEAPVEAATTDGGADTGATDTGTSDGPRDTGGTADAAAGTDAPRSDGGSTPTDDEGDCGCRLGGTGRSSATLPLVGALAGAGFIVRRRRRR
jgi:MYXO-CTERM domain-containing protein